MVRATGAIVGAKPDSPAVRVAHVLQMLRLFIPKHHLSVIAGEACLAANDLTNSMLYVYCDAIIFGM